MNWMRRIDPSMDCEMALASDVLPVPGTSSSSRWPSASMQIRAMRTTSLLPLMNDSTFAARASNRSANQAARAGGRPVLDLTIHDIPRYGHAVHNWDNPYVA